MDTDRSPEMDMEITKKDIVLTSIYGFCIVSQVIALVIFRDTPKNPYIVICGFVFLLLFFMFGGLPYYEFKKMGGVPEGKSYMSTTRLVDTGIYSVVRHPQWLSWVMFSIALILFTQHWLSLVLGITATVLVYIQTYDMDRSLIKKFGENYIRYMKRVPKMNFILGIMLLYRRKKYEHK
ncbi:MAG: isoprenylcysteine carboxylmethyltransferase family protein [Theionarchaea archaeon]|nr:isoprenylcysteine carboxylmethyltransferase family protein [Theionarchaea archaeon]